MPRVVRSTVLDRPLEEAWAVLRDFNGHDRWHPAVAESQVEKGRPADAVGCVRRFRMADGGELRERLLSLSDAETAYSYCLLETPIPLFNYVSHVRLLPVTDGDRTFWQWRGDFDARPGEADAMAALVGGEIYEAGFAAIRRHLAGEGAGEGTGEGG